jgi:serine/threonine-protein kinase
LPFEEDGDALGLLFKHAYEQPAPLIDKAPFLPPALAEAVMAGLATDPADRSPSAEAFALGVAEACTAAWGPGWLESEGVPLMGAGRIVAATERQTGPVTPAAATPAPKTVTPTIIRPVTTTRAQAVGAADVAADQVVPVQSVLPKPAPPVVPVLAALAGTGVALLLAFTGLGSTAAPQSMGPRLYPAVHRIDLSKPIRVPVPTPADEARITLEVLHKPIVRVSAPVVGQSASIDASGRRFLISGRVSGEVELLRGNTVVARQGFQADMAQPWYQSVPGLAGLVVLLVAFAYGESFLRSLRAGRKAIAGRIGLVVCGALLGASFVDVAWTLGKKQPTTVGLIVTCLVAVAAGVAAGATATRIGRRRRYRPVSR